MKTLLTLSLVMFTLALAAGEIDYQENGWRLHVQSDAPDRTTLSLTIDDWSAEPVKIAGQTYYLPVIGDMERTYEKGAPSLPKAARSLMIPAGARMSARVTHAAYTDHPLPVAPSKGLLPRNVNHADVAWEFGEIYSSGNAWPQELATLGKPYILRNVRGAAVTLHPMQYLPGKGVLRVYHELTVEVFTDGDDDRNVIAAQARQANRTWDAVFEHHFVNYPLDRYTLLPEFGRMAVICHDEWADEIAPWVEWKNQRGVQTDVYLTSAVGSTADSVAAFIEAQYNLNDGLTFVTLVGDAPQIPPVLYGPYSCDPLYGCITGDDFFPELFIGRISAETAADVTTQVQRFLAYERDLNNVTWPAQGLGLASSLGTGQGDDGESDWVHLDNIRTDLLGYTYDSVDQIYATTGATTTMVSNALNNGRSIVNYCGHGTSYSWSTTGYSGSHIDNLTNMGMLPYIYSVACYNGNFRTITCFAERWMRAVNAASEPIGAIGFYGSSISQLWAPPMCAQDEFADLLCAGTLDTFGALCFVSSFQMMDEYGVSGESTFRAWMVFGDPSMQVRTAAPTSLDVTAPTSLAAGASTITVDAGEMNALVSVSRMGEFVTADYTDFSGAVSLALDRPAVAGETYHIVVSRRNAEAWRGDVSVSGAAPQVQGVAATMQQNVLTITWNAYPGAETYNVYYSVEADGPFVPLTTRGGNSCTLAVGIDIPDIERLYFRVTAVLSD